MFEWDIMGLDISTSLPCIKMAICNFRTVLNAICRARSHNGKLATNFCLINIEFLCHVDFATSK